MDAPQPRSYHRTTIYLTEEQRQWLTRLAAQARLEGSTLSASDVIRYALTSLQERLPEAELREAVIRPAPCCTPGPTTENRKVGGSIPSLPTRFAQLSGLAPETPPLDEPQD